MTYWTTISTEKWKRNSNRKQINQEEDEEKSDSSSEYESDSESDNESDSSSDEELDSESDDDSDEESHSDPAVGGNTLPEHNVRPLTQNSLSACLAHVRQTTKGVASSTGHGPLSYSSRRLSFRLILARLSKDANP